MFNFINSIINVIIIYQMCWNVEQLILNINIKRQICRINITYNKMKKNLIIKNIF